MSILKFIATIRRPASSYMPRHVGGPLHASSHKPGWGPARPLGPLGPGRIWRRPGIGTLGVEIEEHVHEGRRCRGYPQSDGPEKKMARDFRLGRPFPLIVAHGKSSTSMISAAIKVFAQAHAFVARWDSRPAAVQAAAIKQKMDNSKSRGSAAARCWLSVGGVDDGHAASSAAREMFLSASG